MRSLACFVWIAIVCGAALLPAPVAAQVPQLISYQGRVAVDKVNFDGNGLFKFALINGSGSNAYWTNDGTHPDGGEPDAAVALAVSKGLYSVLLGDATLPNMQVVPATVFTHPDVRLRVWFNDGQHGFQLLTPDQRIAAVGYAIIAGTAQTVADGAITSEKIAAGAVGSAQLAANLTLSGTLSAAGFSGSGQGLTNLSAGSLTSGTLANAVIPANIPRLDAAGNEFTGNLSVTGTFDASGAAIVQPRVTSSGTTQETQVVVTAPVFQIASMSIPILSDTNGSLAGAFVYVGNADLSVYNAYYLTVNGTGSAPEGYTANYPVAVSANASAATIATALANSINTNDSALATGTAVGSTLNVTYTYAADISGLGYELFFNSGSETLTTGTVTGGATPAGQYFTVYSGTNSVGVYTTFEGNGSAPATAIAIPVALTGTDTAVTAATKTAEAMASAFTVTTSSNVLTITNTNAGLVTSGSANTSGYTVTTTRPGMDPHLSREVWIAFRTDGIAGDGTQMNPFDGRTAIKFDAAIRSLCTEPMMPVVIHVGPGLFRTEGVLWCEGGVDYFFKYADTPKYPLRRDEIPGQTVSHGWVLYEGWKIIGSGRDATTLQFALYTTGSYAGTNQSSYVVGSARGTWGYWGDGTEVRDMTIDCNFAEIGARQYYTCAGVELFGKDTLVDNVRVINAWGNFGTNQECFAIFLSAPFVETWVQDWQNWPDVHGIVDNAVISNCIVEKFQGNYTLGALIHPSQGTGVSPDYYGTIRNCVFDGAKTFAGPAAAPVLWDNLITNCASSVQGDIYYEGADRVSIRGNTILNAQKGITLINPGRTVNRDSIIENNTIIFASGLNGKTGIGISKGNSPGEFNNFAIRNNTVVFTGGTNNKGIYVDANGTVVEGNRIINQTLASETYQAATNTTFFNNHTETGGVPAGLEDTLRPLTTGTGIGQPVVNNSIIVISGTAYLGVSGTWKALQFVTP